MYSFTMCRVPLQKFNPYNAQDRVIRESMSQNKYMKITRIFVDNMIFLKMRV